MIMVIMVMMMMILVEDDGMEELETLFRDEFLLRSNLLDMDDEELLFVVEITSQERARAREFPNGNGEFDESCHGDITSV
jgi:hypothetical protein